MDSYENMKEVGVGWLLEFYVLTTSKVMSAQVPTCDSAHSWRLYNAASLRNRSTGTMT